MNRVGTDFGAAFILNSDDWEILDVTQGDEICFIFDGKDNEVLSIPIVECSNKVKDGYVYQMRGINLTEKLFRQFVNSTSIECKIGCCYDYSFTEEDLQAFTEMWAKYQELSNR